jgi:hypothetical protein
LLAFANDVRRSGGADLIEGLFDSKPGNAGECLIARALNFSCYVDVASNSVERYPCGAQAWWMVIEGPEGVERANKIAEDLGLEAAWAESPDGDWVGTRAVVLPEPIGLAALAFDQHEAFTEYAKYD